jgi:glycosyltransferase involved in cell wall biosynthesis
MKNSSNLKILFVAPLPPPITGQSVACELLYKSLQQDVEINLVDLNKKTFKQGIGSFKRVLEIFKVFVRVRAKVNDCDIIYFTVSESVAGMLKDLIIFALCHRKLSKVVIHLHGGAGMRLLMSNKHMILNVVNSFFMKRIGAVVVLGDRLKNIYSSVVTAHRLHAVTNFACDEFFVTNEAIDTKFASAKPLRLLFLSNHLPGKGHIELLEALTQLSVEKRQLLHVDFAGGFESPEDEFDFRKQVLALECLQVNVHGVVQGEHKRQLFEKAHLFCLPTYYPYEGQPISILEAYASGCAVMTTNHSGIFDTFTPDVNGLEVLPRKPESIRDALLYALAHPKEIYEYAKTNRVLAEKNFRASIHLKAIKKVIFSV